jgi:2-hydroxyglutarate dehydrogenase
MDDTPLSASRFDVAVVGAGILGLATARELLRRRPRARVVVVEREAGIGRHQTGHNSGVVHAGIYYAPGSLKARLCVAGAAQLEELCAEHGIALERCGKVVVAVDRSELPRLDALEARARANGVPGLRRLTGDELREIEPHCAGVAALHSPGTGIVDFGAVARAMADAVRAAGGEIALGREVRGVQAGRGEVVLEHDGEATVARHAIFCAGLWSDRLAVAAGAQVDPRIVPFRGQYLRLAPAAQHLVRALIYPVPNPELPFLGVHLTRHVSGDVLLGPTALLAPARDAYRLATLRPRDLTTTLAWPGTWRLGRRWWRTGIAEIRLATSRRAFVAACARYIPELNPGDVQDGWAGVRAQAVARDGRLLDDFAFSHTPRALHIRNAPSPAATSSLAIATEIVKRADQAFA